MILIDNKYTHTSSSGDYTVALEFVDQHMCTVHYINHHVVPAPRITVLLDQETLSFTPHGPPVQWTTTTALVPRPTSQQRIPKHIIQTDETLPESVFLQRTQEALRLLNPEYTYTFYDAQQRRDLIQTSFPSDVVDAYDTLVPGAFQADLFRYCCLYVHGGCYVDLKMIPRVPFAAIIDPSSTFLIPLDYERTNSMDPSVGTSYLNALLCCTPRHPYLLQLIRRVVHNVHRRSTFVLASYTGTTRILDVTGPTMVYDELHECIGVHELPWKHTVHGEQYTDYRIVDRGTNKCLFTKTCIQTKDRPHYSNNWANHTLFYINKVVDDNLTLYVYPHTYNDTFSIERKGDTVLLRRDQDEGWGLDLRIKYILNHRVYHRHIGPSADATVVLFKVDTTNH